MEVNRFGRTSLNVSLLTFGCGAVGGLMTKGAPKDQDYAVAWARDHGINHFDTAPSYGNTISETNLGRSLGSYRDGIIVSTKVGFTKEELLDIGNSAQKSLEASLKRLRQDHVDIFQLHNTVNDATANDAITVTQVMDEVVSAFTKLQEKGMARYLGFTAKGDTDSLHALLKPGVFDSSQVFYNLLIPSAGEATPENYPGQDYRQLLQACKDAGVGTIGVRILAGGALSGSERRHSLGMPHVTPIGSGIDYRTDVKRSQYFNQLIDQGYADSLPELSVRFSISHEAVSTVEIGIASYEELQIATRAINKGPLANDALLKIKNIQSTF